MSVRPRLPQLAGQYGGAWPADLSEADKSWATQFVSHRLDGAPAPAPLGPPAPPAAPSHLVTPAPPAPPAASHLVPPTAPPIAPPAPAHLMPLARPPTSGGVMGTPSPERDGASSSGVKRDLDELVATGEHTPQ